METASDLSNHVSFAFATTHVNTATGQTLSDTLQREQAMTAKRRKGNATWSSSDAKMPSTSTCPHLMMMWVANPGGTSAPNT